MAGVSKTVLVEFQDHSRVVSSNPEGSKNELESLKNSIENAFQDVFSTPPAPFFLKLFDKELEQFIDVRAGQSIPDKGVIQVYLLKDSKVGELKNYVGVLRFGSNYQYKIQCVVVFSDVFSL